jgi:D-alanyl-D-alanine carboxypeptidase
MKKIVFPCCLWIICCVLHLSVSSQQAEKIKFLVQGYLDSVQKANGFPGMTLTYVTGSDQPVHLATGFADRERNIAMRAGDVLLSGSTPKMFYSVVIMKLVNASQLQLDDPIWKYLGSKPWFNRLPNGKDITVRHLLQHTSGIPEYYTYGDFMQRMLNEPDKNWSLEELIAYILDQPVKTKAGERFSYADTNYLLLGLLVELLTDTTMYKWVDKEILSVLKMKHTKPSDARKLKGLVMGYSMPKSVFGFTGPTIKDGKFVINPQFELMGGGYVSNTIDWAIFIKALFAGQLVDTTTLQLMMKGVPANTGREHQYGLGLQIRPSAYGTGYGHGGWFPGYLTEVEYFPQKNMAIAVQCNTDDGALVKGQLRGHLVRVLKIIVDNQNL